MAHLQAQAGATARRGRATRQQRQDVPHHRAGAEGRVHIAAHKERQAGQQVQQHADAVRRRGEHPRALPGDECGRERAVGQRVQHGLGPEVSAARHQERNNRHVDDLHEPQLASVHVSSRTERLHGRPGAPAGSGAAGRARSRSRRGKRHSCSSRAPRSPMRATAQRRPQKAGTRPAGAQARRPPHTAVRLFRSGRSGPTTGRNAAERGRCAACRAPSEKRKPAPYMATPIVKSAVGGGAFAWILTAGAAGNLLQRRSALRPEHCAVYNPWRTAR